MAKLSSDHSYVTVEKGDTLSQIALTYKSYTDDASYQKLAEINGISNPNRIYVGQKIYLTKTASGGSSSSSTASTNSNQITFKQFGLQSNTDKTLFATWEWGKHSQTEHYRVRWLYGTGDDVAFVGEDSTTTERQATYTIPDHASTRIIFKVLPVSKTKTDKNGKETAYFTAKWSEEKYYYINQLPPDEPSAPSIKIENNKLTATLEGVGDDCKKIEFQIIKNDSKVFNTGTANVSTLTSTASYSCSVDPGAEYKVRCRAIRDSLTSEWGPASSSADSGPAAPAEIITLKALSSTSVQLDWTNVSNAETYTIEWTTKKMYFDSSNEVDSMSVDAKVAGHAEITGLGTGEEYFFRVRAVKGEQKSAWTPIKSIILGRKPSAPTTWSSTTTVIVGNDVYLYWVHNAEDNSTQTLAKLKVTIGSHTEDIDIENIIKCPDCGTNVPGMVCPKCERIFDESELNKTSEYKISTGAYTEGTQIKWQVQTAGVTREFGDWSVQRSIDVYAQPSLEFRITDIDDEPIDILTSFPFFAYALAGPATQVPVGYHLSILSNEIYETIDYAGNKKIVNKGEAVYSKYVDTTGALLVELSAGNVDLENNISYTAYCTVAMNSGLTAESSYPFRVSWTEKRYEPNAEISIDTDSYSASIRAYCEDKNLIYSKVFTSGPSYIASNESLDENAMESVYTSTDEKVFVYRKPDGTTGYYCIAYFDDNGNVIDPIYYSVEWNGAYIRTDTVLDKRYIHSIYTTTGEEVLLGLDNGTTETFYCIVDMSTLIEGVTLSVYRREYDGSFTELATGLQNTRRTFITDPHPALDYARYRIVAIADDTGAVSFYDVPGYPVGGTAIIIQWDEEWSNFDVSPDDPLAQPPWSGSLLKLPYNIAVSDSNSPDVEFVEYIGRKHPVGYYGTQVGDKSTWKTDIPATDEETLYALRRLQKWMGDVYVREPSGSGYWANITVSFSQKYRDVVIPVTINVTRVEGGV